MSTSRHADSPCSLPSVGSGRAPTASIFAMSATDTYTQTYTCGHCHGEHSPAETVEGSFCSDACYYRHKGANLLERLEADAHFCNSCFAKIRDVDPIPPNKLDGKGYVGDGYQHATPNTDIAVDDFSDDPYTRLEGTRWGCACGNVNPSEYHGVLVEVNRYRAMANLFNALADSWERDAIPHEPDFDRFVAGFRDPWRGAEWAVGRSVYG